MSPRAWRWNSETVSSCSNALTWRETADCDNPSCSPAWVKLPASAAAWKTFSLSQSMINQNRGCEIPWMAAARDVAASPERSGVAIRCRSCGTGIPRGLFGGGAVDLAGGEKALRLQRRHAPHPRRGHRLAVHVVGDVAGREHARHRGGGRGRGLDVAGRLHLDLAGEQFGGRRVADGEEHAVGANGGMRAGFDVAQLDLRDLARMLRTADLRHLVVQITWILGCLNRRSCRMRSARN